MPQLSEIRYFVAAAENGSLRQAAETLGKGQSCVSRSIMRLEDKLGVSLFERSNTGVRLTNAGARFLEEVQPALTQIDQARHSACAAGRAEAGTVRIGTLTSLTGGFLRELLVAYRRDYPMVRIDVRDGGRDDHIAALRSRCIDIVFVPGARQVPNCECAVLWCERMHVALARGHRLAGRRELDWPDLCEEKFITSSIAPGPEVHDYILRRLAGRASSPRIEARCAGFETLMNLVSLGEGITAISEAWSNVTPPDLVLRPLSDPEDVLTFSAIWLAENDNPALRCLVSSAHVLSGQARRGNSDWMPHLFKPEMTTGSTCADARKRDPSP